MKRSEAGGPLLARSEVGRKKGLAQSRSVFLTDLQPSKERIACNFLSMAQKTTPISGRRFLKRYCKVSKVTGKNNGIRQRGKRARVAS